MKENLLQSITIIMTAMTVNKAEEHKNININMCLLAEMGKCETF